MEALHQDLWILPVIVLNSLHFISNILRWKITSHSSTSNQVRPNFPSDSQTTKVFFSKFTMDSSQLDSSIDLPIGTGGALSLPHGLPRSEKKKIAINIGVHIMLRSVSEYFSTLFKGMGKTYFEWKVIFQDVIFKCFCLFQVKITKIFSAASDLKPLLQKKHTIRVNIISFEVILWRKRYTNIFEFFL